MKRTILFISLAMAANTAFAASDYYIYAGAGQTQSDRKGEVDATIDNLGITAFTSSYDDTDPGFKLQGGWQVNKTFAVEGGYLDFGKFIYSADATAPITATRDGFVEADGWNIGLVARKELNKTISVFGKAGVLRYNIDYRCEGTGIACTNPNRSDSGTNPFYGIGLAWHFKPDWFFRAEYEIFSDIGGAFDSDGSNGTTKADIDFAGIGIGYQF